MGRLKFKKGSVSPARPHMLKPQNCLIKISDRIQINRPLNFIPMRPNREEKTAEDHVRLYLNNSIKNRCPVTVLNVSRRLPALGHEANTDQSPKWGPIDLALRAAQSNMKTAFILITNRNLNFQLRDDRGYNRCQRQHESDDVEICFMHTLQCQHRPCQQLKRQGSSYAQQKQAKVKL